MQGQPRLRHPCFHLRQRRVDFGFGVTLYSLVHFPPEYCPTSAFGFIATFADVPQRLPAVQFFCQEGCPCVIGLAAKCHRGASTLTHDADVASI